MTLLSIKKTNKTPHPVCLPVIMVDMKIMIFSLIYRYEQTLSSDPIFVQTRAFGRDRNKKIIIDCLKAAGGWLGLA